MSLAHVVLLEDDGAIQQFVRMALEELPIRLSVCARVQEALTLLRADEAQLVITDLMLPDRPGTALLAEVQQWPHPPRVLVFSAGLLGSDHGGLKALGAWRLLAKPCSVRMLEDCVREGIAPATPATGATAHQSLEDGLDASTVLERVFDGNEALYQAFRASCLAQFPKDVREGDEALRLQDAAALRRLTHSLKSVLLSLGHVPASRQAAALEELSQRPDWRELIPRWQALREQLLALR